MAFYSAPLYNVNDVIVESGYTPPLIQDSNYSVVITDDGLYSYRASSYNHVNEILVLSGYQPPSGESIQTTLTRVIEDIVPSHIYPQGFEALDFGLVLVSQEKIISTAYNDRSTSFVNLPNNNYVPSSYQVVTLRKYNDTLSIGSHSIRDKTSRVRAWSDKPSSNVSSEASIVNATDLIKPIGIVPPGVGTPSIINFFKTIQAIGKDTSLHGRPLVYNKKQFLSLQGIDSQVFGKAYLMGGVKYLMPRDYDASVFGKTQAINTTADQTARPTGIKGLSFGAINVSPSILYPSGFYNNGVYTNGRYETIKFGSPDIRDPAIKPIGKTHTTYGNQTVWYHTRPLIVGEVSAYESGYPKVFDPTQFVTPVLFNRTSVFGDVKAVNKSVFINPTAIFDEVVTQWLIVENNRRYYTPAGLLSQAFGNTNIINKTPSLFVDAIAAPIVSAPSISYRIRQVKPIGFDHFKFGNALLTKPPEISPKGFVSSVVESPTIWYKNRIIDLKEDNKGIDSFDAGKTTAWFRYRFISPAGWFSNKFNQEYNSAVLTHGVRTIYAKGFVRDTYGTHWASHGVRAIVATSIESKKSSNHMVGGTRHVIPNGYVATQWGTRIIPESQQLLPIGFSGIVGVPIAGLYIRYIKPFGYITVGTQAADRWGATTLYNKLQFIQQDYDISSGLAPPRWPDWTLIENRNKRIGASGFISQQFGYSQIDNGATAILPHSINPPAGGHYDVSMVSHAIRAINPIGIESPPISSWSIAYNGARPIAPSGSTQSAYGSPSVVNTRRNYRFVGRIDSFESGTPMISYRIRAIDIEKRYTIAPPIIRLPTIDLWARYVSFRGFETAKYGEPSLFEHFNIIETRWSHKEKQGEPRVYNVTPEVGAHGHESLTFGGTKIRTQWRHVYAEGDRSDVFGKTTITDTEQNIIVNGWLDTRSGQKHEVIKTGTNPYTTQYIFLTNDVNGTWNALGPSSKVGHPLFNQNVLYGKGFDSKAFGQAFVRSNVLDVSLGIYTINFPLDSQITVTNGERVIDLQGEGISSQVYVGINGFVSPFYIKPDPIKPSQLYQGGVPTVTNEHRTFGMQGLRSKLKFGSAEIFLRTAYVKPYPFANYKIGIPLIPFTPQAIKTKQDSSQELFGVASVARPPYVGPLYLKPFGIAAKKPADNIAVDFFHRTIRTIGSDSLAMGKSLHGDKPFMWQGLRIGERVPIIIGAGDTSSFGTHFISLIIRQVEVEGFNAFASEYDLKAFEERMRVKGSILSDDLSQGITTYGVDSQAIGSADIKWGQQFIRPDGNSDQFRKGAF